MKNIRISVKKGEVALPFSNLVGEYCDDLKEYYKDNQEELKKRDAGYLLISTERMLPDEAKNYCNKKSEDADNMTDDEINILIEAAGRNAKDQCTVARIETMGSAFSGDPTESNSMYYTFRQVIKNDLLRRALFATIAEVITDRSTKRLTAADEIESELLQTVQLIIERNNKAAGK